MSVYSNNYILEFAGDEKKNKEYLDAVDKAEEALNWLKEDCKADVKKLDEWKTKIAKIKNEKDLKKFSNDFKNFVDDEIKRWNANEYKSLYTRHYENLRKLVKLSDNFNNKYSSILMEQKKEIDMRFSKIADAIFEVVYEWVSFQNASTSGKKLKEFNEEINRIYRIDRSYFEGDNSVMKYISFYYQQSVGNAFNIFRYVGYIRHCLGLEREDKLLYKIINKIFK